MIAPTCLTPNCRRERKPDHRYCDECYLYFVRNGTEPVLAGTAPLDKPGTVEHVNGDTATGGTTAHAK